MEIVWNTKSSKKTPILKLKSEIKKVCCLVANYLPNPTSIGAIEKFRLRFKSRYDAANTYLLDKEIMVPDVASYLFMKKELFDCQIYQFKSKSVTPYIIDCGANIGLSALYFKKIYPKCKLIAFEPDPIIFKYLNHNVRKAFDYQDITLVQKGVWDKKTSLHFMQEGADGGRIADSTEMSTSSIETVRLKDYLQQSVDFLKIDIEGAETTVLLDCAEELINVENLFIEYHSFTDRQQDLDQILTIITKAGFRYNLQHAIVLNENPFLQKNEFMGIDSLINIFAYRNT